MASKRNVEPLDPVIFVKLPRLEQDPGASFPTGKPGSKPHFDYKGSYFACALQSPDGPSAPHVRQSPASPHLHYGTGAGSQPVPLEGPGERCPPNPPESVGIGLQPPPGAEMGRDRLVPEPVVGREKWGSAGPGNPFLVRHPAMVTRAPALAVPRPMYRAPAYFMDLRVPQPLQQRPGNADWALPAASRPFHPGEHRRGPHADPSLPLLHPGVALPGREKVGTPAAFSPYYAAFHQYQSSPKSPFLDDSNPSQTKVPETHRLSPDPWHKLCPPAASTVYQERPPEHYPSLHKAPLVFPPLAPTQPCAYRGFGFEGSREPYPGTYLRPQAPWRFFPTPSDIYMATAASAVASPPAKPAALPRDAKMPRQEGCVLSSGFAFSPGGTAVPSTSRAHTEPGCEQHQAEGPHRAVVVRHSSAFQPVCTQEAPGGSGGIPEAFPKGESGLGKQELVKQEGRASSAPQETPSEGPQAAIIIEDGNTSKVQDAAKDLISPSPPASLPEGPEEPRDSEVPPPSPPMPVIKKVFSLASYGDFLEQAEGSDSFCREHLWEDAAEPDTVPTAAGQELVQGEGESGRRGVPGEAEPVPLGCEEEEVLDLSVKKRWVEVGESLWVLDGEGGKEEEKDAKREAGGGEGTQPQREPFLVRVISWDKSSFQSSASSMVLRSPSAAPSTRPALSSTIPAPSCTILTLCSTSLAPSRAIPALSSAIPSPSRAIPALSSAIPAPSRTIPAPSKTMPALSSTISTPSATIPTLCSTSLAPSSTIPSPSRAIPAPSKAIPAPSRAIPALSSSIPAPSSSIPAPSRAIPALSSSISTSSRAIPTPSNTKPALSSTIPSPPSTIPAPPGTIPALSGTIPAPSGSIPAPSSTIHTSSRAIPAPSNTQPAPSSSIPAPSSTIPSPPSTIPAPSSTIPSPSRTMPALFSTIPALSSTTPAPSSAIPALPSTLPALPSIIPALSSVIPGLPSTFPLLPNTIPALSSLIPPLSSMIPTLPSTIPAPSSTIPGLSSTIPAPSSTIPGLSSTIPAPSSTIHGLSSTIPAPSSTIHGLSSTIPAPSSTIPGLSSTIPAPSSTIPGLSSTIPAPSSTIPGLSSTIPAPSSTIPGLSSTIPAPSSTIHGLSSTIPAPSSTIHGLSSTIPAPSSTVPALSSTIPAPSGTIPALSSILPALSSIIPPLPGTIPAPPSFIPTLSTTIPAPPSTIPTLSSTIPAPPSTIPSTIPTLSTTIPSPPSSPQRSPAPCSISPPASPHPGPQPSPLALPEPPPYSAPGEDAVPLPSAGHCFTALHTGLCDLLSCSVARSSPQRLREWLQKAEPAEEQGEAMPKSPPLEAKNGSRLPEHHKAAKGKEAWLALQDVPALLANLLSQLEAFMGAHTCPFPHVVRAGAVFIPIHVVKEKLFPKLPGVSVDQVLQEHKVELRPTTLSEERHLRDLELKSCTSRMLKLLALKQLPDIYPDLLNLHWHNSIKQQLDSSSMAGKNPSK